MQTLSAAFKYLAIWHFSAPGRLDQQTIGRAAKYFPVVGLVFGLMLVLSTMFVQLAADTVEHNGGHLGWGVAALARVSPTKSVAVRLLATL